MSSIFDDIRIQSNEVGADHQIRLGVDRAEVFDYNTCQSSKYSRRDFLEMISKISKK